MKAVNYIIFFMFFLLSSSFAAQGEIWFHVLNNSGGFRGGVEVSLYQESGFGGYVFYKSGYTSYSAVDGGGNGWAYMVNEEANGPYRLFDIPSYNKTYLIKIDDKYMVLGVGAYVQCPDIHITFENESFSMNDSWHDTFSLSGQGDWNNKTVTVKNSFNDGQVYVDGNLENSGITKNFGSPTFPHILKGKTNQTDGGYIQAFDKWLDDASHHDYAIETSIDPASATYNAKFSNQFNITFKNQFPNGSNGGVIKVDNTEINSPTSTIHIKEDEHIIGEGVSQVINGYHYMFDYWNQEGGSSSPYDFVPGSHKNYTAIYRYCNQRHLSFNGGAPAGTPIKLYWHKREVPNITSYQIWRKVGKFGTPAVIANVSSNTSTYTDYSYVHSSGTGTDLLLHYDVRYYANGSYASPEFMAIYGEEVEYLPKENNKNSIVDNTNYNAIAEYGISSFPNPFNPTTNIYFKVKEPGLVSIKVYDMLGKEVAILMNEEKPNGDFVVKFDGSNLASGIYILTMQINDFYKSQKLLLTK